jgi:hypothetical protein
VQETISSKGYDRSKTMKNVEYFKYVVCMIKNDVRYTREIKPRIAMAKEAFNKKVC